MEGVKIMPAFLRWLEKIFTGVTFFIALVNADCFMHIVLLYLLMLSLWLRLFLYPFNICPAGSKITGAQLLNKIIM